MPNRKRTRAEMDRFRDDEVDDPVELECPVCYDTTVCLVLGCNHAVCAPCLGRMRKANTYAPCPICRRASGDAEICASANRAYCEAEQLRERKGLTPAVITLYETALMQYEQGEAMRLEHPYVQHNMGLVLGRLGGEANLTRAVSCFKAHIDMNPSEDAGYLGLANCYCDLHQYDLAISTLHAALRVLPDCEDAHFNLGSTLRHRAQTQRGDPSAQRSDFEASVAAYQAALRLSPEHSESSHNLGLAFLGLGMLLCDSDKLASRRALGDALLADHDHHERHGESDVRFDCALRLGNVHSELGHYTQAEAWYREAIRLNPQQSEAYWNLGRLLDLHLGRPNAALDSFRTHHALHPNCAEATYFVAHALARARPRGDEAEMIALLRRAIELDPSFSSPYPKIGALYCDIDVVEGGDLLMTFLDLASREVRPADDAEVASVKKLLRSYNEALEDDGLLPRWVVPL